MSFNELLDWCDLQGDGSIRDVVAILEHHQNLIGRKVGMLLWEAATGQSEGGIDQSPEAVEMLYRRFPVLPGLRPLAACPTCGMPTMSIMNAIRHAAEFHLRTAAEIAAMFREGFAKEFPKCSQPPTTIPT